MYSSINFYICINPRHRHQIKLWNILEPILEGSHMFPPSQYSSAPKIASVLIFITIESFAWFWVYGFTQCVFDVKTCLLCSFTYSLGQTQVPNSKLSIVKIWGYMMSALHYTSCASQFQNTWNSFLLPCWWCLRCPVLKGWTSPWPFVFGHCW